MSQITLIEIRVVRPSWYPPECQDPRYMTGHFFTGVSYAEAKSRAQSEYPGETLNIEVVRVKVKGNSRWMKPHEADERYEKSLVPPLLRVGLMGPESPVGYAILMNGFPVLYSDSSEKSLTISKRLSQAMGVPMAMTSLPVDSLDQSKPWTVSIPRAVRRKYEGDHG